MDRTTKQRFSVFLICFLITLSFFSVFEFGSCAVTWTYDAPSNTATASGSGSTNFAALVAADIAGAWGVFWYDSTHNQIVLNASIVIGNGVSFVDTNKQIYVICRGSLSYISVSNGGSLTLGSLLNETIKSTKAGCQIIMGLTSSNTSAYNFDMIAGSSTSTIYLYSCDIIDQYGGGLGHRLYKVDRIWNCHLQGMYIRGGKDINVYNLNGDSMDTLGYEITSSSIYNKIFSTNWVSWTMRFSIQFP